MCEAFFYVSLPFKCKSRIIGVGTWPECNRHRSHPAYSDIWVGCPPPLRPREWPVTQVTLKQETKKLVIPKAKTPKFRYHLVIPKCKIQFYPYENKKGLPAELLTHDHTFIFLHTRLRPVMLLNDNAQIIPQQHGLFKPWALLWPVKFRTGFSE